MTSYSYRPYAKPHRLAREWYLLDWYRSTYNQGKQHCWYNRQYCNTIYCRWYRPIAGQQRCYWLFLIPKNLCRSPGRVIHRHKRLNLYPGNRSGVRWTVCCMHHYVCPFPNWNSWSNRTTFSIANHQQKVAAAQYARCFSWNTTQVPAFDKTGMNRADTPIVPRRSRLIWWWRTGTSASCSR